MPHTPAQQSLSLLQLPPALLQAQTPPVQTPEQQLSGLVHAWPTSVQLHVPFRQAPVQHSAFFWHVAPWAKHAHVPSRHPPVQHSSPKQLAPLALHASQVSPDPQRSLQQSEAEVQGPTPSAAQAQMPAWQFPEQQLALLLHKAPAPLHSAQTPAAQTPLQHSEALVQLPAASVQAHVPLLHTPLQQALSPQACPFSEQGASLLPEPEPPPLSLAGPELVPESRLPLPTDPLLLEHAIIARARAESATRRMGFIMARPPNHRRLG